jgi:hypothetical protein
MSFSKRNRANLIAKGKMDATLNNSRKLILDPNKELRVASQVCKCCHYIGAGGIVMHAFTKSDCKSCLTEMSFPNSGVDKYCLECAQCNSICKKCGADIEVDAAPGAYDGLKACDKALSDA